ncbi:ABC transporter substrate-binding protein [Paenibacillus xylanexedens]|uniref:ABC transporter substrate-binding protein n=1 Tax=Paenibacillus xylanexedens TaxID=528191 RepID=UPI000F54B1F0|nr:ABC transporter substrate-binding protein [Paenibacillus xylanexedens]RPK31461.1 hypothetical protein EDO6_02088 [Paenibacillus xylanexedens]
MKNFKRNMKVILVMMLSLTLLLSACSKGNEDNASSTSNEDPTGQKEVVLKGYLLGEAPKGMPEVLETLNKKLKKDINATIELNYISWGDVQSKYPLLLATGEDLDFIFSADWNYYVEQSNKGAFYELKPEDIAKYMPKKSAAMDSAAWEEAKINDKIYMIPKTTPDSNVFVSVLRKDIMAEAGLTEVKHLSEIGSYLEAVKKNHPNMVGLNLDSQVDLPTPYQHLMREKVGFTGGSLGGGPLSQGAAFDFTDPSSGKIYSMVEEPYLSAQKYAANIMKDWYDKGYVNKNPYANKIRSKDNFVEGKSAVAFGNSIDIAATIEAAEAKGIETYIIPSLMPNGKVPMGNHIGAGISIAANSKNPERVMQAFDLIMEDPSYVYLTYFGIEGKNYVVKDDKVDLPEGLTAETNTYPPDSAGFWFVNKALFKPMSTWPKTYIDFWEKQDEYNTSDYALNGFNFNTENVKTQIANLANASTQYANPIYIGAVKDVDKAFDELNKNLSSAGLEKVKEEAQTQVDAFLTKKK